MNVGLLISFDFTMNGMLFTEAMNYNSIFQDSRVESVTVFHFVNVENIVSYFKFPYKTVEIKKATDIDLYLSEMNVLFTWVWSQEFTKNLVNRVYVENYKVLSKFTQMNKWVCYRLCDTRHFPRDYKMMIEEAREKREFEEENGSQVFSLDSTEIINYDRVMFLCNGKRDLYDWAPLTVSHAIPALKKDEVHRVYLSDAMLFQYNQLYDSFVPSKRTDHRIYHVGNLNPAKTSILTQIANFAEQQIVARVGKKLPMVKIIESFVEVRTPALCGEKMYEEMSSFQAYLFIGNGDADICYYNKTLYDASIGRVPFLIFQYVDENGALSELSDYYFHDTRSLSEKFKMVAEEPELHLKKQRDFLLNNQSAEHIPWEIF